MKALDIYDFISGLENTSPEIYRLLRSSRIVVHPAVRKVTLHGSRSPASGCRAGSNIDLYLIADNSIMVTTDAKNSGCIGIYKVKGFDGLVPPTAEVEDIYPLFVLWEETTRGAGA